MYTHEMASCVGERLNCSRIENVVTISDSSIGTHEGFHRHERAERLQRTSYWYLEIICNLLSIKLFEALSGL